jgi:hypothetical protein
MNKTDQTEERAQWITDRATRFVKSQGYGSETAEAFASWCHAYAPEVQGFANLFDHWIDIRWNA